MKMMNSVLGGLLALGGLDAADLKQDLTKDPALVITDGAFAYDRVVQAGSPKKFRYQQEPLLAHGLHFVTGSVVEADFKLDIGNSMAGAILGVHGEGSVLRYSGHWKGDGGGSFPLIAISKGGKLVLTEQAHVDLVLADSFFTRQIWAWGDGTGVIELEEGFLADRTEGAKVPDAMGTIRMAGLTLITHHSRNLPANLRPDGRGGIYANGHVVFEGELPSTWRIASNPQRYSAQVDFAQDGIMDCQMPFTHHGQRRVCLQVGPGGEFVSTGAFRTTATGVTITKTGPAMLSLDGQQGYKPGSTLVVAEGLLRMHTDPAAGNLYDEESGDYLSLVVKPGARAWLGAPRVRLESLTVEPGGILDIAANTEVIVSGTASISDQAIVDRRGVLTLP
jgi:hypothetical protein